MMMNIDRMRKEIFHIEDNVKNNLNLIEMLKKIISQKQNDIQLCTSILNMCKDNYKEKKNNVDLEKYIYLRIIRKSIEKYRFRKEAVKLKKFADFSFIFFNKKCGNLYHIPFGFEIMFSKNLEEKSKYYGISFLIKKNTIEICQ
jgi:hypothetical protein